MAEIIVCDYLTDSESQKLVDRLRGHRIQAVRLVMNASVRRIGGALYSVLVKESDLQSAGSIVREFKKQLKVQQNYDKLICPRCKSRPPKTGEKKNLGWFKKIISYGTTVMFCSTCGKEWYI